MIRVLESGQKIGEVGIGLDRQKEVFGPDDVVTDGDTVPSRVPTNLGVRFLGVDAPETQFEVTVDDRKRRLPLNDPAWETFLKTALDRQFTPAMTASLKLYLTGRLSRSPKPAENHHEHGMAAKTALRTEVEKDIKELETPREKFRFHLAFAPHEAFDKYGRLLCYINRKQAKRDEPTPRPDHYQERLLEAGLVMPFFIWPNVDPFIKLERKGSLADAVILPNGHTLGAHDRRLTVADLSNAKKAPAFTKARTDCARARQKGDGIFSKNNELAMEPNEIRFLSSGKLPRRWVIDLSNDHPGVLIPPQYYFTVRAPEDRLYIPEEYVPLFLDAQWKKQTEAEAEKEAKKLLQLI